VEVERSFVSCGGNSKSTGRQETIELLAHQIGSVVRVEMIAPQADIDNARGVEALRNVEDPLDRRRNALVRPDNCSDYLRSRSEPLWPSPGGDRGYFGSMVRVAPAGTCGRSSEPLLMACEDPPDTGCVC
jgi:hypothetical protein